MFAKANKCLSVKQLKRVAHVGKLLAKASMHVDCTLKMHGDYRCIVASSIGLGALGERALALSIVAQVDEQLNVESKLAIM